MAATPIADATAPSSNNGAPPQNKDHASTLLLSVAAFVFLALNCGVAVHRSRGDPWSVSFVAVAFLDLASLHACLHLLERTPRDGDGRRRRLKAAVWALTALLTAMFSYRVAALMPLPLAALVWGMAAATVGGGFYVLFVCGEGDAYAVGSGTWPGKAA